MTQLVEGMSNISDSLGLVPSTTLTRTWKVKAGGLEIQGYSQLMSWKPTWDTADFVQKLK